MNQQVEGAADLVRLVRELEGRKCFCGAKKNSMNTFCPKHYFSLSKPMREALYNRVGQGYEEAYAAARHFLKTNAEATQ